MVFDLYLVQLVTHVGAGSKQYGFYTLIPCLNKLEFHIICGLEDQYQQKHGIRASVVSFHKVGDAVKADTENCSLLLTRDELSSVFIS